MNQPLSPPTFLCRRRLMDLLGTTTLSHTTILRGWSLSPRSPHCRVNLPNLPTRGRFHGGSWRYRWSLPERELGSDWGGDAGPFGPEGKSFGFMSGRVRSGDSGCRLSYLCQRRPRSARPGSAAQRRTTASAPTWVAAEVTLSRFT